MPLKGLLLTFFILITATLSSCATPYIYPANSKYSTPQLYDDAAVLDDGYRLPVRRWGNPSDSKAIVLAVHGLNDYSFGFDSTGDYLAERGVSLITYDQRGFGATTGHGYWHGSQRMIDDSLIILRLLRERFPDKPLFLLGESMGGAVVLATIHQQDEGANVGINGVILIAPAIWSRQTMPWYQRALLWFAVHTVPAKKLTGEGLDLIPSDNIEMLRAMGQDPLVIKATRVDVLYGMANLMDLATAASTGFRLSSLILYGKHDQIVPREPTCQWLDKLPELSLKQREIIIYENGYHMLNRDLQAKQVLDDIVKWINIRSIKQKSLLSSDIKPLNVQDYDEAFSAFCKKQK
jgi:alpha-beta hydrolase superfamily lysophospholipase